MSQLVVPEPAPFPMPEPIYDVSAAAEYLGVSEWTVRDWIKSGKLTACKLGTNRNAPVRIKQSDLARLLVPYIPGSIRD